jgi:radical SAM superfamily enzyme YgiQ (UPF0313 family)
MPTMTSQLTRETVTREEALAFSGKAIVYTADLPAPAAGMAANGEPRPHIPRRKTHPDKPADVTLLNLNLMLVNLDGTFDQQVYTPLGLLYIAGCLEQAGANVEFLDYQTFSHARTFDVGLLMDAIGETADLVGISCMSNLLPFAILVAEELKRRRPGRRVVLGGVGPSPVAREIVEAFPFIDSVVEGEGELILRDFWVNGRVEPLPPRQIVTSLDTLPLPSYHLLDYGLYDAAPSVITSRGCPYKCTFCTEPYNFAGRVSFRDVDSILEEIELVHARSGKDLFLFQDDILPLKRRRFSRLLEGFRNLSFPMRWKCFSRVDLMDDELMREMAASGCVQVRYGIESGSNRTLETIRKGFRIEEAFRVAARSLLFFPSVHCSFIWGYPFEDMAEFEETLRWVSLFERVGLTVLLFEYSPLPGSPLYRQHQQDLVFSQDKYSGYVITGVEHVKRDGQNRTAAVHDAMYRLIADHPRIFSGFYRYTNTLALEKRQRLSQYWVAERTGRKNEHDL